MTCQEARQRANAHLDGELDAIQSAQMDAHLKDCAGCARDQKRLEALRDGLRGADLYYRAPVKLRERIRSALPATEATAPAKVVQFPIPWMRMTAIAAGIVLVAFAVVILAGNSNTRQLAKEIESAHVRSLMAGHLMDVASTDQHTVKPWFNGRVEFAPVVHDLAQAGYPLIGGRLDYLDERKVAALVYQRQKHTINLFTWASSGTSKTELQTMSRHGYNFIYWKTEGMEYWAISDLNETELKEFASLIRDHGAASMP